MSEKPRWQPPPLVQINAKTKTNENVHFKFQKCVGAACGNLKRCSRVNPNIFFIIIIIYLYL